MLARLARTCYRRRWRVVIAWILGLVVVQGVASTVGSDYHTNFALPQSEAREVQDLLEQVSEARAGFTGQLVFKAEQGVNDPGVRAALEPFFAQVGQLAGVEVSSPYAPDGSQQISPNGTIGFAELSVSDRSQQGFTDLANEIMDMGDQIQVPGLTLEYGGDLFATFELPQAELLGVLAAVVILLVAFGSVLAMGLPLGTALLGLGIGFGFVALASHPLEMPDFAPNMAAMIGLGVGIDYALFIVTRYREGLHLGLDPEDAVVESVDTSGRAVLFAGITVVIALLGLFLVGLAFVTGLAVAGAIAVAVMVLAALTLLPALLAFVRQRIEVTTYRGVAGLAVLALGLLFTVLAGSPAFILLALVVTAVLVVGSLTFAKGLARQLPARKHVPRQQRFWYRWSRLIQHRPWPSLVAAVVVLLLLASPLFSIRLGFGDAGNYAESQPPRRAFDLLAEGFGPGVNGPLVVVVRNADQAQLDAFTTELTGTEGVDFVNPPVPLRDDLALISVYPTSAPQDEATTQLVHRLRDDVIPASGVDALVGGGNAANVDFSDYLAERLPWLIGTVLVLSFLLLMAVFRSVLVPLKAVVMNLLSIGAAYGIIVAVFQWGWGASLIGVGREGPIDAWVPMFLFAITFGLSMDYEVFLLSRMKEEYDRTGDNATAVADGLASTARVITAAALIMVCVFGAFVLADDRSLKLFGLGLAVAVLVDATIVRMLLVPATMELLGDRNWWLPKWLGRIIPKINVEGHGHPIVELEDEEERVPALAGPPPGGAGGGD